MDMEEFPEMMSKLYQLAKLKLY